MRGPTIKRRFYCTSWHNLGHRGDWLWYQAVRLPEMLPKILMLTGELSMISAETVQMEDWKMNMNDELNGVQIKELRKGLGLTQEEFAHAVAVTFSTVNRWENGHAKPSKLARRAIEQLGNSREQTTLVQPSHSIEELVSHRPTGTGSF